MSDFNLLVGSRVVVCGDFKKIYGDKDRWSFFYKLKSLLQTTGLGQKVSTHYISNNGLLEVKVDDLDSKSKKFTDEVNKRFKKVAELNSSLPKTNTTNPTTPVNVSSASSDPKKKVLLIFVLDRSSSMSGRRTEALESSLKKLLLDNNDGITDTDVSALEFSDSFVWQHKGQIKPINEFVSTQVVRYGNTALNDAIFQSLEEANLMSDKYDLIHIFAITDGEENASKHSKSDVKEKVLSCLQNPKIKINLLGSEDSRDIQYYAKETGLNEYMSSYDVNKIDKVLVATSSMMKSMRTNVSRGLVAKNTYTPEQLASFSKV